jgi:hypothetical protein
MALILLFCVYAWWMYFKVYSDGNREGILIKFSRKGDVFKTYEGEIVQAGLKPGGIAGTVATNNLFFSVTDQKIADSLEKISNKIIKLHYNQYRKSLPWRGENYNGKNVENGQYIVDRIESVTDASTGNALIGQ